MTKITRFNCVNGQDRIAANDYLNHLGRKLRHCDFRLVAESGEDGSFDIRITSVDASQEPIDPEPTPQAKRSRKAATASPKAADTTTTAETECCKPE